MNYPASPLRRQHRPPRRADYAQYRRCLRLEFEFRCPFCLSTEMEVGPGLPYGGFEIEHFRPSSDERFKHLRSAYENLLWACRSCNLAKSDVWPSEQEIQAGAGFLDPDKDAFANHLEIVDSRVVALNSSVKGEFTIDILRLNSALQRHRRENLSRESQEQKYQRVLESVLKKIEPTLNKSDRAAIDLFNEIMRDLRPWDSPTDCLCPAPAGKRETAVR